MKTALFSIAAALALWGCGREEPATQTKVEEIRQAEKAADQAKPLSTTSLTQIVKEALQSESSLDARRSAHRLARAARPKKIGHIPPQSIECSEGWVHDPEVRCAKNQKPPGHAHREFSHPVRPASKPENASDPWRASRISLPKDRQYGQNRSLAHRVPAKVQVRSAAANEKHHW